MSFSAPSHGAGYFPFGESNQSHSRWTRWSRRHRVGSTALAPCLARAGANRDSQAAVHGAFARPHVLVRALAGARQCRAKARLALSRALGIVAAASRQRGKAHFDTAIHGLRFRTANISALNGWGSLRRHGLSPAPR